MKKRATLDNVLRITFLAYLAFLYGAATVNYRIFPYDQMTLAAHGAKRIIEWIKNEPPWYFVNSDYNGVQARLLKPTELTPGLRMVSGMGSEHVPFVMTLEPNGSLVHKWDLDWFDLWPEPSHIPADQRPRGKPGTHVHGMTLLPDGDLVFNFEHGGMIRIDLCGNVKWRLPYQTHHVIEVAEDGTLWTLTHHREDGQKNSPLSFRDFGYYDEYLLNLSPNGKVIQQISISDLIQGSDLKALLYMQGYSNDFNAVSWGDSLHPNDVEIFPSHLEEGLFRHGDIMLSFRNINTIVIVDGKTHRIKHHFNGRWVRQHDPDFIDGYSFTVFDNHNVDQRAGENRSRIILVNAKSRETETLYEGTEDAPFFTNIMGNHQRLQNGNMILSESMKGRVLEVNSQGELVWDYHNLVGNGRAGIVEEIQLLPPEFDAAFSKKKRSLAIPY